MPSVFETAARGGNSSIINCVEYTREDKSIEKQFLNFPEGFLWGAATSHFQVEGHPHEIGKRNSDWSEWCAQAGRIADNTTADTATEFYKRYATDIEICRNLNLNSFRLSLNWPALCPDPPAFPDAPLALDPETVKYYRDLLISLKKAGITTFVTLFHFTLPLWLSHDGGWNNPRTVHEFERFAKLVAKEFSDVVDYWITLNEPLAYAYQGYISGVWPPGDQGNYLGAFKCVRYMLEAHARAYAALHAEKPDAKVSFTLHWRVFEPLRHWHPLDHMVRFYRNFVFNEMFLNGLQTGRLDFPFPISMNKEIKKITGPVHGLKGSIDYLAINYYTRELSEWDITRPFELFGKQSTEKKFETNCMGWETYPDGLYNLLVNELAPYRLNHDGTEREIIITENGFAMAFPADLDEGDWSLADDLRVKFLASHLLALHNAIKRGANVKGYLYWSLTDNFEWAEGLSPRFGLVRVSYPTQERVLRKSARVYADIARRNGLDMQLCV